MTPPTDTRSLEQLNALLTPRDEKVLEDLDRLRMLTTRQIQRLRWPVGAEREGGHASVGTATRLTHRTLNRLCERGFITRLERRIGGYRSGSAGMSWQLGPAGDRWIRARQGRPNRRRYLEPSSTFQDHTIEVAELAVELIEASRARGFEILQLDGEPTSWRTFQGGGGRDETLRPDLYLVTADSAYESSYFVEVDRATEHLPAILRKCQTYERYWRTGREQRAHGGFPLVVWVVPSEERAAAIQHLIDAELPHFAKQFLVATRERAVLALTPTT